MKTIRLSRQIYRGDSYIFFNIPYDENFNRLIRTYPGRMWSNSRRCWYINDDEESYRKIRDHFRGHFNFDATGLFKKDESGEERQTGHIYNHPVKEREFGKGNQVFGPVSMAINQETGRLIVKFEGRFRREWIGELKHFGNAKYNPDTREWSLSATKAIIDSLSDYFTNEGIKLVLRKGKQPVHITEQRKSDGTEVRSEVINIRLSDLNRDRGILHIRSGKGSVDRVVPVSEKVWKKVDEYRVAYKPVVYLFEGQGGGRYTAGSVYNIFKQALKSVGIEKEVGVHSLRHSYATHLHESGYDIRYIQELLGHRSSRTTEIYTHVSRRDLANIRSPIDDLDLT